MKTKSSIFRALLLAGLVVGSVASAQAESFRFASEAPRTDTQFIAGQKFNELLKARTNGALDIKIFADSTLGTFQPAITGVRNGTIDMAISGSAKVAQGITL